MTTNKNAVPATPERTIEGHTPGEIFLDAGDYDRNGSTDELFIRANINGEHYDICSFAADETGGQAKANAARIVKCWNEYDQLLTENKELIEALKTIKEISDEWDSHSHNQITSIATKLINKHNSK